MCSLFLFAERNRRMANSAECFLRTLVVIGILSQVTSDAFDHKYNKGDPVPLYVNKVGPYCNPSETYPYYDFPFCPPDLWQEKEESLGEVLNGDRLVSAPYKLNFRYENDEELADNQGHTGWKIIHGDVFRYPKYKCCLAAAIGCGTQLFAVVLSVIIVGVAGVFHPYDRGVQKVASVIIYAITNVIAGFTAVSFYHQLEGSYSAKNLFLAGSLFCGPLFLTFCFLNTVAGIYESTAEISMGNIVKILLIWVFIALPLLLLGGTLGKMTKSEFQAPCRSTKCPREIPPLRWYRAALPQMAIAGFLPFSVFYIELYPIFASIWGFKEFTAYGVLCVFFIFLVTITALVSIGLTYLQLAAEDHQWWWRSFLCGGSTGLYVYAYCFFFYFQSEMSGFLQTSFFFGYMTCSCFGLFLLLGTVGFRASLIFVRHIYSSIKFE
ncbi:transmembrane 9 superfamily member 2-like isoform X4 [Coffea arabica]|uniref:Transmembrane 9 superfamily member n=1 Tax=Coffea arabica TaxID=13443 RepID=A0ABM4WBH9_COFAR